MDCLKGNISLQYVTFADVDKELLISTYQCQKLKKALLSNMSMSMKMKGWKDKTTEI
jgi:hypothetical protein